MIRADARIPVALTIAGSDSSGGAGIQADLKTFAALGVYGASVITALTAQNTLGVQGVSLVDATFVGQQMESVFSDLNICAIKTGMLATAAIVAQVADRLASVPDLALVVDPVMVATSGHQLLADDAVMIYRTRLLPQATLLTPNLPEAARLLGELIATSVEDVTRQAQALCGLGARAVLVKGGHAGGSEVVDVLCDGGIMTYFRHPRIATVNTHGTGCTLSAAIVAHLTGGAALPDAVAGGIAFLTAALEAGAHDRIGAGHGPVRHSFKR